MPSLLLAKKAPHMALSIPEVVALILNSLPPREIKYTAAFVCKLWYILARPLLYTGDYFWLGKIPLTRRHLLETLGNIRALSIISSTANCYYIRPSKRSNWPQLQNQVQGLHDEDSEECFSELFVSGSFGINSRTLKPVTMLLASLKSIKIENTWMKDIQLGIILERCLALENLEIHSSFQSIQFMQLDKQVEDQTSLKSRPGLAKLTLPERTLSTGLRHLSIRKVSIELRSLEQLLAGNRPNSCISPLTELHLVQIEVLMPLPEGSQAWTSSNLSYVAATPEDEMQILERVQRSCPSLKSLHFSLLDSPPLQKSQAQLFKKFPNIQQWSLPHSNILPSTFLSLQAYLNNVTSLELTCSNDQVASLALHEYLCCSPHLRHLRTHSMIYPAEYMDLEAEFENGAGLYSPRNCHDTSPSFNVGTGGKKKSTVKHIWLQKRVWACRELETLQIKIGGLHGDARTARNSRVMFAYFSLVCPHLRDLSITRVMMNVEQEGGLCYLGTLYCLERLVLQASHFWIKHVSDLQWVQMSSISAAAKLANEPSSPTMNRNRLGRTITRTTTRSSLASRSIVPLKRSRTRTSFDDQPKSNLLSRVVGKILGKKRGSRGIFGKRLGRDEMIRVRTAGPTVGPGGDKALDRAADGEAIIRRLTAMSKPEAINKQLDKIERKKIRAEAMSVYDGEDCDIGYCWPVMELFVMDAACTLTAANFPKLLVPLVHQAIADIDDGSITVPDVEDSASSADASSDPVFAARVRFIRRLREALYKGSALCGGPYGINALGAVNYAIDPEISAAVNSHGSLRGPAHAKTREEYQQRGRDLFQTIYQKHTEPILTKIGKSSQDLVQSIIVDTYGRVLSDTSLITIPETELCLVATLVPLDVPPQLKSHVYGSRNVGVPMEQVQQLVSVAESITQWVRSQGNDKSSL
ncbi:hypothetical protein BGZ46_005882 [Entomortierella lignicola]|nr:hypothetical protein BGZ46_005882 [Entomortierella lignicola]